MAATKQAADDTIYQFRIDLLGLRPPIWRRLLVRGDTKLSTLHDLIQVAMGWHHSHLHQFTVGDKFYGDKAMLGDDPGEIIDQRRVKLNQLGLGEQAKFSYVYDFGDYWEHQILIEKLLPADPTVRYPTCVAGKRACPPEDTGGVWGYADFIEAISDPKHEEHEYLLEWVGGAFDPEAFSMAKVNAVLARAPKR